MSALVTVALSKERVEKEYKFDFDEWITDNGLQSVKQILIKHKATALSALSFAAVEFQTVLTDPQLLSKAHMIPKLTNAVHNISTKTVHVVRVADDEHEIIESIKQKLKSLNETQQQMEQLRVEHPNSIHRISASKWEKIQESESKVNQIFDALCESLNARRKALLKNIDDIKATLNDASNDDDEKENDMIAMCTDTIRNCSQFLKEKEKIYNALTSTNENRTERKTNILELGQKVSDEFKKTQTILKDNMARITQQIAANHAVMVEIDFVVNRNVHKRITRDIQKFGIMKNKTYKSAHERTNDVAIRAEDEVEADKMRQQQRIQELETNITNITAQQQHRFAQLKDSLSFCGNKDQTFRWFRDEDGEKKENEIELVKIMNGNPMEIVFVDKKTQTCSQDALSLAPPVETIAAICKCNSQIVNGMQTSMDQWKLRDFVYKSDFDRNGICYALGTEFGSKEWRNPMQLGLITVYSLHGWYEGKAEQVFSREVNANNYTDNKENGFIRICFNHSGIRPTAYSWRHDTCNGDYPRSWDFEGSNDGVTWEILKRHLNDKQINAAKASHTWAITNCNKSYKMFRFKNTGTNSWGNYYIMCSGFEIYGRLIC